MHKMINSLCIDDHIDVVLYGIFRLSFIVPVIYLSSRMINKQTKQNYRKRNEISDSNCNIC